MRPLKRELSAEEHAEARRRAQIAALASAALGPLVQDYEAAIIDRLVNFVRARAPVTIEQVWTTLGELAACREIRIRTEAAKQAPGE